MGNGYIGGCGRWGCGFGTSDNNIPTESKLYRGRNVVGSRYGNVIVQNGYIGGCGPWGCGFGSTGSGNGKSGGCGIWGCGFGG